MFRCLAVLVMIIMLATSSASAESLLPKEQWTPNAKLWLSRAMIAEAGWESTRDHIAIAYVLARRWRTMVKRFPRMRFVDVIRFYCSGLEPGNHSPTRRQVWLKGLTFGVEEPDGWPSSRASWEKHLPLWRSTLTRAARWGSGVFRDPCSGRAWHWGGTMDLPKERMYRVDCGETLNTFYGLELVDKEEDNAETRQAREAGNSEHTAG